MGGTFGRPRRDRGFALRTNSIRDPRDPRRLRYRTDRIRPWHKVHSASFSDWVKLEARLWGCDPDVFAGVHKGASHKVWPNAGRAFSVDMFSEWENNTVVTALSVLQKNVKGEEAARIIRLPHCIKVKTLEEARHHAGSASSIRFRPVQVCGHRNGVVVIQALCTDNHMQFIVANLQNGQYLANYVMKWTWDPFATECILSPDLTRFVMKPSIVYGSEALLTYEPPYLKEVRLIQFHSNPGLCKVEKMFRHPGCARYVLAFDPRYGHTRIAIGNIKERDHSRDMPAGNEDNEVIVILDLRKHQYIARSAVVTVQKLTYSPDGSFIATLAAAPCFHTGLHNFTSVHIHDSDSLDVILRIPCTDTYCVPLFPAALFPMFSECGTHLIVGCGRNIDIWGPVFGQEISLVEVYKLPVPINLQYMCRVAIRRMVIKSADLWKLSLPEKMVDYLMFGYFYE